MDQKSCIHHLQVLQVPWKLVHGEGTLNGPRNKRLTIQAPQEGLRSFSLRSIQGYAHDEDECKKAL